jgi:hypothetical protein
VKFCPPPVLVTCTVCEPGNVPPVWYANASDEGLATIEGAAVTVRVTETGGVTLVAPSDANQSVATYVPAGSPTGETVTDTAAGVVGPDEEIDSHPPGLEIVVIPAPKLSAVVMLVT